MALKQDIIRTMQSTMANGMIAKRFFHVTAPQHVDSILEKLQSDEVFYGFILLPNSKKHPTEALICTNRRLLIWNNEFADDDEIALSCIHKRSMTSGWFNARLTLETRINHESGIRVFKCEKEIMTAFESALGKAISNSVNQVSP